jgi:hypothetical protein
MKLYYDKRLSDPTYYIQEGIRNGKKVSSRNVGKIGKHSELLKLTDDPLAYALEQIAKINNEKNGHKVSLEMKIDFNQRIKSSNELASKSNRLNIGYLILQRLYRDLDIGSFFKKVTDGSRITFNPDKANRFMTYVG